jgi:hypothetical protein
MTDAKVETDNAKSWWPGYDSRSVHIVIVCTLAGEGLRDESAAMFSTKV